MDAYGANKRRRMKRIILLVLILFCEILYANDSAFYISLGSLVSIEEKNINIEMKEEYINITLFDNYYEVDVDFSFFNYSETVEVLVGFPFLDIGYHDSGVISQFKTWTNNEPVDYKIVYFTNEYYKETYYKAAYTRKVIFKGNTQTKTKVHYVCSYNGYDDIVTAVYLYGSGACWKNKIGKINVKIENNTNLWFNRIEMPKYFYYSLINWTNENTISFVLFNVEPDNLDTINVYLGKPWYESDIYIENNWWKSLYKKNVIDEDRLNILTKSQLRLLRNSIYAYNGYVFKSDDLRNVFTKLPWYKENQDFIEDDFSVVEKTNIRKIQTKEGEKLY